MPELPDVEGFRRYLQSHATGAQVEAVEVRDRAMLRNSSPQAVGRALAGRKLERPERHGKWLFAPAGGPQLVVHFGMTGLLVFRPAGADGDEPHRHDRLILHLDRGCSACSLTAARRSSRC